MDVSAAGNVTAQNLHVPADSVGSYHVNLSADVEPDAPRDIVFKLEAHNQTVSDSYDAKFITKRK